MKNIHKHFWFLVLAFNSSFIHHSVAIAQNENPFGNHSKKSTNRSVNWNENHLLIIEGNQNIERNTYFPNNLTLHIQQGLTAIRPIENKTEIIYGSNNLPKFIQFKILENKKSLNHETNNTNLKSLLFDYIIQNANLFKSKNPLKEWIESSTFKDEIGMTHIKMKQYYKGIKVWNGELFAHYKNAELESINANIFETPIIETKPFIANEIAEKIAEEELNISETANRFIGINSELTNLLQTKSELIIYNNEHLKIKATLAYHISIYKNTLEHWEIFIDAKNANVLYKTNSTCADGPATANAVDLNNVTRTLNTYLKTGNYYLLDASRTMFTGGTIPNDPKGAIVTFDQKNVPNSQQLFFITSTTNAWTDKSAISAHFNGGQAYEYFKTTHNRNSLDSKGGNIYSIVNVPNEDGTSLENAFWNGQFMLYGNGGAGTKPLAGGLDVAAHEMTHGVIQNTANLEYKFQSGAINESMADIFGVMVDRDDWKLGEDIAKLTMFPSGAMRDLSNPHNGGTSINDNGWQPSHMSEFVQLAENQDNGGVHINSGIVNKAFFLFATAINKEKAEKIYYRALSIYLTRSSNFVDLRIAVVKSAGDLYGTGSNEVTQAGIAFDGVGIGTSGGGGGTIGLLPQNPGTEFLLAHSSSAPGIDPNSLYIVTNPANPQQVDYHPIATLKSYNKPSITDNGTKAYFVAENLKPYSINLSIPNPVLTEVSNASDWNNIAVSKDGNRIALISKYIDTAIFVFDFALNQMAKFHLYNPTTASGQSTDGPLFANSIEWDYTGNYLIYDAYNVYKKSNGDTLAFWDIGTIKVWDKQQNNFGNGTISKLVNALSEGISIGNPAFSKNSPNIIAFDYYDGNTNAISVIAGNMETGDFGTIYQNNTLGYPTYNKQDNVIDFSYYEPTTSSTNIATISMQSNKILPSGAAQGLIAAAKWPIFYANGNRIINLNSSSKNSNRINLQTSPNPFQNNLTLKFSLSNQSQIKIILRNYIGQIIYQNDKTLYEKGEQIAKIETSNFISGIYLVEIMVDNNSYFQKLIKP